MPGLVPGIRVYGAYDVDGRDKLGHDEGRGVNGIHMSELDKVFGELAQKRSQQDQERGADVTSSRPTS